MWPGFGRPVGKSAGGLLTGYRWQSGESAQLFAPLEDGEPLIVLGRVGRAPARKSKPSKGQTIHELQQCRHENNCGTTQANSNPEFAVRRLRCSAMRSAASAHLHGELPSHPDVPLQVHARYSRLEIMAAFGIGDRARVAPWQTGVYEVRDAGADLLAFTLDKSSGSFSPTTRYRDYAISPRLIHWESQSVTRADSETGLRYRHHERDGRSIMLFTRLRADDRAFWFLGPATYRGHVGEKPMAITWELHNPLPGDLYQSFAAAVA